ncbi:hypothetical protein ACN47E_009031 [Coniothyrium glycines]
MTPLQQLQQLSAPHCVVLAAQYATEANIAALRALTALREPDLPLELVLRILLSYLPEEADPASHVAYLHELATNARTPGHDAAASLDTSGVELLSSARAQRKRHALELVPLVHPLYAVETGLDAFGHFLIHRAHRIDAQTGLLDTIPQLVVPFLGHSEYLRTWFISTVLPLLRLSYEYYPQSTAPPLDEFAQLQGRRAIDLQLSHARSAKDQQVHTVARDLKGLVAPWMCGATDRKRRRLGIDSHPTAVGPEHVAELDDWDSLFQWLLHTSKDHFTLVTTALKEWDGPEDMDLGGYEQGRDYVDDERQRRLEMKYAQTALACLYSVDKSDVSTLLTAHSLLRRICDLLNFRPFPDLTTSVDALPSYDLDVPLLSNYDTNLVREDRLLEANNNITKPSRDSVRVLELVVFSAHVLSTLQYPISIRDLAKICLRRDQQEQLTILQKILHTLSSGAKNDSEQWITIRLKLVWLWNWDTTTHDDARQQGVFGTLDRQVVEVEILRALLESNHDALALQIYVEKSKGDLPLLGPEVEQTVLTTAMHHYDNASNGNRARGGMKRAADIIATFAPQFPTSSRFRRAQALMSATHAMSYYSLILQHGVPLQPVNIRVSSSPLSLIGKLLKQNLGSYTKLDDLISIGQNLVIAMPATIMDQDTQMGEQNPAEIDGKKAAAERRVIGMAIDAALEEGDFETAYSYVVNRLTPLAPTPPPSLTSRKVSLSAGTIDAGEDAVEDVAWQAALRAGRYNAPLHASKTWSQAGNAARPDLRRLEQRMDLLSQALLLAPPSRLEEVLVVWQQCELELTELLAQETAAEQQFNDAADRKLPGAFDLDAIPAIQPTRRELGRGTAEEAPMGLFDVARGAASAFSKTAFPLRGSTQSAAQGQRGSSRASLDLSDSGSAHEDRIRKRDMLAGAASGALSTGTGALASGLGWVLGAKPVSDQDRK